MRVLSSIAAAALAGAPSLAQAACPQALAVYGDADSTLTLEFRPNGGEAATVTNRFRVAMENDIVLDGIVQWTADAARPVGMAMYKCPEGDVTGEELNACTVWHGVVYALDAAGAVGLLPLDDADAAERLLLPDFGRAVRHSAVWGEDKVRQVPWDVLSLSGCQE